MIDDHSLLQSGPDLEKGPHLSVPNISDFGPSCRSRASFRRHAAGPRFAATQTQQWFWALP